MDIKKDKDSSAIHYNPELFHNNQQFYLAYRKIQHIVSAIFLITGNIDNHVVLKQSLQEHGLKCLSQVTSLIGKSNVGISDIQLLSSNVIHINSLLDIGFWSGSISQMNLSILQQEISSAYKILNDLSASYKNSFFISSSFFRTDKEMLNDLDKKPTSNDLYKRQGKGLEIKDTNKRQESYQTNETDKGQRKEAIISLLKQKQNLTVKDFLSVVPNCSEKTIQRELTSLVEQGTVKKQGERRWSTYSISVAV